MMERYNVALRLKYIFLVAVGFLGMKKLHDLELVFKKELEIAEKLTKGGL